MGTKKYIFTIFFLFIISVNLFSQPQHTFCRNGINLPIVDNGTVRDSIFVNAVLNNVLDVNVRIDTLLHSWVGDLKIELRKNNIVVRLFNNTGGSGDNFTGTILNDSGIVKIDSAAAPFTGSFRPYQSLSAFNNNSSNGYWSLTITDNSAGDSGLLKTWCLVINPGFIGGINEIFEIPNTYRLYQNYPNPFNPVTKIKYGLPENGYVKLTVYNDLGEEIIVLQDGYKTANTYEAEFNASDLPSGMYYYKMEAKGFIDSKKMVIVK